MSLYNMIFGFNKAAPILLAVLGITPNQVPRFRDAYLTEEGQIAIYTRTGGGNREYYEGDECDGPSNHDLRSIAGFASDTDDEFDCTYATFFFNVPDETKLALSMAGIIPVDLVPQEKFRSLLEKLSNPACKEDPEVKQAIEAAEPIVEAIANIIAGEKANEAIAD